MNNSENLDRLERRAVEQRARIDQSVGDLKQWKTRVEADIRQTLDPKRQAREHFWAAAGIASLLGLIIGHSFAGIFVD